MIRYLCVLAISVCLLTPALADTQITPGAGATVFNFNCQSTKTCPASVDIDSTGNEKGTPTNPISVNPTGGTTQPVSGNVGVSGSVTANQGTANANPWPTTIVQGPNTAGVTAAGRLSVDIGATSLTGTVTANQGAASAGGWLMQPGNTANTTPWLFTMKQGANTALVDSGGGLKVTIGNTSIPVTGNVGITGTVPPINLAAAATGGCTGGHFLSAASNNATAVKSGAGTLCELVVINTTVTNADLRLYDAAGTPNCASATGVVANYPVQGNAIGPGFVINLGPYGKAFTTGIGICLTASNADNDNTNTVTGINVNYAFK